MTNNYMTAAAGFALIQVMGEKLLNMSFQSPSYLPYYLSDLVDMVSDWEKVNALQQCPFQSEILHKPDHADVFAPLLEARAIVAAVIR